MQVSALLKIDSVSAGSQASSKKRALEEAAALLAEAIPDIPQESIYESLLERERLGSTGVGHGIALPHARIVGLNRAHGAFVQLVEGVDYDAIDGSPVDLLFALVVPQEATEEHLQLLAQLATLFSNDGICGELRLGKSPEEILSLITRFAEPPGSA